MHYQLTLLTRPALLALLVALGTAGDVQAHRLDVQAFVRPGRQVQIESWFSSGEPARGARVQVFRADEQLLAEGTMDKDGVYVFSFTNAESLRVVISAGTGHRKELLLSANELGK